MAIIERIVTVYNDAGSKKALKDLNKLEKQFGDAGKKIAKAFAVATVAAGALALKIGKDAVQAAMEDQKAQALLANQLRNTAGASDTAIAAAEGYINSLQMQFGVADDELRPALAKLAAASGDLAQAQTLLGLALDVSAGSGQSLESVSAALAKAQNGNFTALSRMFPQLDKNAIKTGDLVSITKQLADAYGGAAATNANTFAGQMQRLRIAFGEALESIGTKFLPVLQNLAAFILEKVVPAVNAWIDANGDKLASAFETAVGYIVAFAKSIYDVFKFVADNLDVFKKLAAVIIATFAGAKVAAAVGAFVGAIKTIINVMKLLRTASLRAAAASALATGGVSAAAGAAAFAVALIGVTVAMNKFEDSADNASEAIDFQFNTLTLDANDYTKGLSKLTVNQNKNTAAVKKATDAAAKELAIKKALAALAKLGIKPTTETDPIQLEAARLNLLKQANLEEQRRVAALIANAEAQMRLNEAAQRYADILQVLADAQISPEEVLVLAQKWQMTTGQVLEYIARIYAANTTDINDGPIVNLLMKWGLTKQEAEKYVDFTRALKDEVIDDKEIEELMGKWKMSRAEVLAYALQVRNGTAFSDTWKQPGDLAANSWLKALQALNDYLAALRKWNFEKSTIPPEVPPVVPPKVVPPVVSPKIIPNVPPIQLPGMGGTSRGEYDLVESAVNAIFGGDYPPGMGQYIGTQIRPYSSVGRGEYSPPGIIPFAGTSTLDYSAFRAGERGGITVVVNNAGSVIAENDLVETVRNGLLLGQGSGLTPLYDSQNI